MCFFKLVGVITIQQHIHVSPQSIGVIICLSDDNLFSFKRGMRIIVYLVDHVQKEYFSAHLLREMTSNSECVDGFEMA